MAKMKRKPNDTLGLFIPENRKASEEEIKRKWPSLVGCEITVNQDGELVGFKRPLSLIPPIPSAPVDPTGEAYARPTDLAESKIAASAVRGSTAHDIEDVICKTLLKVHPEGLTNHQICDATGMIWGSISPRIKPLRKRGLVEAHVSPDGKWVQRYDTRQPSRVWFLTLEGLEYARAL